MISARSNLARYLLVKASLSLQLSHFSVRYALGFMMADVGFQYQVLEERAAKLMPITNQNKIYPQVSTLLN